MPVSSSENRKAPRSHDTASETQRPASVTVTWINWIALGSLFVAYLGLRSSGITDSYTQVLVIIASIAVPVIVLEGLYLKRFARMTYRRDPFEVRFRRVAIKLLGLGTSVAMLVLTYWVYPYFADGNASDVYEFFRRIWIPLAILTPIYFWFVDGLMSDPEDDYYAAGQFVLGLLPRQSQHKVANHVRSSFVKIFFYQYILSVMFWHLTNMLPYDPVAAVSAHRFGFIDVFIDSIWFIDVAFSCTGYFLTFRLFDSHIRTAEPTVLGWLACLLCYGTFYGMLTTSFTPYEDGLYWGHWLGNEPLLMGLWAIPVVFLLGTYVLGTVQFGIRFSNLTHRGIITNGPFRFTKHPQYISKNVAWWFISVPFINASGTEEAIRHCLMLVTMNVVFYYRAKTEERHLSLDPVYREYAAWIAQHGVFARARRLFGFGTPPYTIPLRPIEEGRTFERHYAPGE